MRRVIAGAAAIATLAVLAYAGATWWSFRILGNPDPETLRLEHRRLLDAYPYR